MMEKPTVVILAAGLGTRMVSKKAKVLHEAGGLALVEHVVRAALTLTEPHRIIVVVGYQAAEVQERLAATGVRFALQAEQKGTGHALAQCAPLLSGLARHLIVAYGDCPLLRAETLHALLERHAASNAAATLITTELANPYGYGRVLQNADGDVTAIVEEKVATAEQRAVRMINSGIYCFEAGLLWDFLPRVVPNPVSKEYYLTDIVELFNQAGHRVRALIHQRADELLGINNRLELIEADRLLRTTKVMELLRTGVTIFKPETVTIDSTVQIGMDSVVGAGCQILGRTCIGEDCHIGTGSLVENCSIASGVRIAPYSILNGSTVGKDVTIGPFARLRGGDEVGEGAHIGNFVELKQTRMGAGAKAGHFAYLGDAEIGSKSNIGAGTIVCNYDGVRKHRSRIGQQAFVGSNSTLVAPVEIGDGAYIAAGSVVTYAVPADSLAIGRGRQTNKEGWAKKKREPAVVAG